MPLQLREQHADVAARARASRGRAASRPTGRTPGCWTARSGSPSARRAGSPAATSSARRSSRCRCAGSRWSASPRGSISPSSSSTSRSTPCVLGCCGPMLTVIVSVRMFRHRVRSSLVPGATADRVRCWRGTLLRVTCSGSDASRRLADLHRIVLAQRIAFPVLRHQQPPQIGMAVEHDAEQVPDFALEPVGRRPDAADRRDVRVVAVQPHLHAQPQPVRDRDEEVDDLEARLARPEIDRGQLGEQRRSAAPARSRSAAARRDHVVAPAT